MEILWKNCGGEIKAAYLPLNSLPSSIYRGAQAWMSSEVMFSVFKLTLHRGKISGKLDVLAALFRHVIMCIT